MTQRTDRTEQANAVDPHGISALQRAVESGRKTGINGIEQSRSFVETDIIYYSFGTSSSEAFSFARGVRAHVLHGPPGVRMGSCRGEGLGFEASAAKASSLSRRHPGTRHHRGPAGGQGRSLQGIIGRGV